MIEFLSNNTTRLVLHFATFLFILWSIVLSLGVVWQVEKRLDHVYKIFTAALIVLAVIKLFEILRVMDVLVLELWSDVLDFLFVIIVFVSLLTMQRTLRDVWKKR